MNKRTISNLKPACSVIEIIRTLELSPTRFYQLLDQGIFPRPIYDIRTKRPFYSIELQELCLNIRESNIGYNGQYILFYSPRKSKQGNNSEKSSRKSKGQNPLLDELTETLGRMGLSINASKVETAIDKLYPDGIESKDHGLIVRDLFRFFKNGV
jgi:hypothetical protein